jgi:hypothetical protein
MEENAPDCTMPRLESGNAELTDHGTATAWRRVWYISCQLKAVRRTMKICMTAAVCVQIQRS